MNNFIFFTDVHLRLTSTRRTDDIFEAQLKKLQYIGKLSKKLKSDFVICGGDLGHSFDWKISMINRVYALLRKEFSCPIYTIIGNHDVPGRNPGLFADTGLGMLSYLGGVKVLQPENITLKKQIDASPLDRYNYAITDRGWNLFAFHSDTPITDKLINGEYVFTDRFNFNFKGNHKIAIVHAPVGPEETPYCKGHKNLDIKEFDLVLLGDIHDGWPIYTSPLGCKICNPGSLTRMTKKDIYRKPQVAIVYRDNDELTVEYKVIPHKAPKDCFDLEKLSVEKEELGKGFLAAIASKRAAEESNPKEYVKKIGTEAGYSPESIKILQDEL